MDFSVFTDTDIEKLMEKMKQKSTADAFGTLLQKAGGEEKMKRQLQENLSQEKAKEDLSCWYGGKKQIIEAAEPIALFLTGFLK